MIFRIARSGKSFHVLHYFRTNQDGGFPDAALIAEDDWLYGTLEEGPPSSSGAVFRMHPDGTGFVVLHAFMETEGSIVDSPLVRVGGRLYGTAYRGGDSNAGTIYRLSPDGTGFKVIYRFVYPHLMAPSGGVTPGSDGLLYGEALAPPSGAVVFAISPSGNLRKAVALPAADDYPEGGLLLGSDGRFYGEGSGGFGANGALFLFDPKNERIRQIHNFQGAPNDGAEPWGRLIQSRGNGRYYGTTIAGGDGDCEAHAPTGCGTVFAFDPRTRHTK